MSGMDPRENGKVGIASMCFIFGLDILSGAVGVVVAYLMKPGISDHIEMSNETVELGPDDAPVTTTDVFADLFL